MKRIVSIIVAGYALFVFVRGIVAGLAARERVKTTPAHPGQREPFVSVIIPAWRDRAALETCLRSLARVDYPDYEVIVVAGGPDGTYEAARAAAREDPRFQVIEQLPAGKNAALNQGLAAARADVLVFLDADSELSSGWLRGLVGALQGDVAASTGNYFPLRETPVSLMGDLAKVNEYLVRNRVVLQGSGGIAVRRAALEVIGPFPEARISSDWDLNARLALHDYRRVFARAAVIRSHRPATLREWWRNELRWRRLHLRSLTRLQDGITEGPVATARHLYPYITAWAVALLTMLVGGSIFTRSKWLKTAAGVAWRGSTAILLARELEPVVAVLAYEPSTRWLPAVPLAPVMTVLTWAACCVASLTQNKAALQFKGTRHSTQ